MRTSATKDLPLTPPFTAGNRMPVPKSVKSAHFLYLTQPITDCLEALTALGDAGRQAVVDKGINPLQIMALRQGDLANPFAASKAIGDLLTRIGVFDEQELKSASLLACEWASPHVDDSYSGEAFLSIVLRTGRHPYVLQSLHTNAALGYDQQIETSTRRLQVGDVFVFDPTTAHLAAPLHPDQSQLLILLQVSIKDQSVDDRDRLLQRFPPRLHDCDHSDAVFAGEDPL
jgi:hypothetical protein